MSKQAFSNFLIGALLPCIISISSDIYQNPLFIQADQVKTQTSANQQEQAAIAQAIAETYYYINLQRSETGIPMLTVDHDLEKAAVIRAVESTIVFDHIRPDGRTWWTVENDIKKPNFIYGENLAYGYASSKDVMRGWNTSKSHYANLMSKTYSKMGIAVYETSKGVWYWALELS